MKRFFYLLSIFFISCIIFQITLKQPQSVPPSIEPPIQVVPPSPPAPQITVEDVLKTIRANNLKTNVTKLCSQEFEGRKTGTKGNDLAANYIRDYFVKCGLKTVFQEFQSSAGRSRNIIAYIEGLNQDEVVIVGGHMDHIGRRPGGICYGADDNASGTAAVMEIAKAFSNFKDRLPRTIVFQCYSGEELGLVGSQYYVSHPLFPRESPNIGKHIFMINLDMIGYYKDGNVMFFGSSGGASDHSSFYNRGVPCVFIHTGTHRYYHTPQDTPEKLNYEGMEKITRSAFKLAWDKVQNGHKTRVADFEKMPITHDHGIAPFPENKKED